MARKQVVEIQCDRCSRTEHREEEEKQGLASSDFVATMGALRVQFNDLCTPCQKTVKNHLEQIGKKIDGLSPDRKGTEVLEEVARAKRGNPVTHNGNVVTDGDVED